MIEAERGRRVQRTAPHDGVLIPLSEVRDVGQLVAEAHGAIEALAILLEKAEAVPARGVRCMLVLIERQLFGVIDALRPYEAPEDPPA